jgi:hypothetical protein
MKKYNVALALANTRDDSKLALARMIIDMMEFNELHDILEYNGTFEDIKELDDEAIFEILRINPEERIKNLEEKPDLKNYDVALAYVVTGKFKEARDLMDGVNAKSELSKSDFAHFEIKAQKKKLEIYKEKVLHDRLFYWLKEENLPQPEIPREDKNYFREIATGWKQLGIDRDGLIIKKKLNKLLSIDYVCIIEDTAWIIEGKQKLNPESIKKIEEYYNLFVDDNPTIKVKKAIVCEEAKSKLKDVCRKNDIEVFSFR